MKSQLTVLIALVAASVMCCPLAWAKQKGEAQPRFNDDEYTCEQARTRDKTAKNYKNPFKPGTYKHFLASKGYPKTYDFWKDKKLLEKASPKDISLVIRLSTQRAVLHVKDVPVFDFPISTGKEKYETPTGEFVILEKDADHMSNLYGTIRDAKGKHVKSNAESGKDKIPKGGEFKGAPMKFFMRLTYGGVGLHVGKVPRVPSSHGCIRVLPETCKLVYNKVREGTPVSILP